MQWWKNWVFVAVVERVLPWWLESRFWVLPKSYYDLHDSCTWYACIYIYIHILHAHIYIHYIILYCIILYYFIWYDVILYSYDFPWIFSEVATTFSVDPFQTAKVHLRVPGLRGHCSSLAGEAGGSRVIKWGHLSCKTIVICIAIVINWEDMTWYWYRHI